jgi:hypothetical protein
MAVLGHGHKPYSVSKCISQRLYNKCHDFYQAAYILHPSASGEVKHVTKAGPQRSSLPKIKGEKEVRLLVS